MNDLEPTPIISGLQQRYCCPNVDSEEQTSKLLSPTPIGPNAIMDVVDVVSTTSLFETMDHTTTTFLQEMFLGAPRGRACLPREAFLLDPSSSSSSRPSSSANADTPGRNLKKKELSSLFVNDDNHDMVGGDNDSRDRLPEVIQSDKVSTIRLLMNYVVGEDDPTSISRGEDFSMSSDDPQEDDGGGGGLLPLKSHWSEKFGELVEFKRRFGHCLVPNNWNENIKLSQWVKRQRHQYKIKKEGKNSSLTQEKIYALDALGFTWSVQEDTWEERFNELVEYKHIYGHTNVPKNCKRHPRLSVWVKYQRRHLRLFMSGERSSMTEERFYKLTKLGFQWNPRKEKLNCMTP